MNREPDEARDDPAMAEETEANVFAVTRAVHIDALEWADYLASTRRVFVVRRAAVADLERAASEKGAIEP